MTTTTAPAQTRNLLHAATFVRNWMTQLVGTLSDEQMLHQPVPGANHALWIIGHSAWCDDQFLCSLAGTRPKSPAAWKDVFGNGSTPTAKRSDYPPIAEVKRALEKNRAALVRWIEGLDEAKLAAPLPDDWKSFAPTHGAFVAFLAAHEGAHVGQLTVIRKSLGMAPLMG